MTAWTISLFCKLTCGCSAGDAAGASHHLVLACSRSSSAALLVVLSSVSAGDFKSSGAPPVLEAVVEHARRTTSQVYALSPGQPGRALATYFQLPWPKFHWHPASLRFAPYLQQTAHLQRQGRDVCCDPQCICSRDHKCACDQQLSE